MTLGERLVGASTQWMTPVGVTVYSERPLYEEATSSWEKWELRGHDDQEHWIEYDHEKRSVIHFREVEAEEHLDPTSMRRGQVVQATIGGAKYQAVVQEVGIGSVRSLDGVSPRGLVVGHRVAYAELRTQDTVISVEKLDRHLVEVRIGTVLDAATQRTVLGRQVAQRQAPPARVLVGGALVLALGAGLFAACAPRDEDTDECTPRTVEQPLYDDASSTAAEAEECHRRSVYGGGGGYGGSRLGK